MNVDDGIRLADRYRLTSRLGTGGMGSVWRAVDEVLDREVAVKVVAAQLSDDPEFVHRFRREARAAARLDHPHIAHVYDYGEVAQDGHTVQYLVMELVAGRTLADRLRDGPIPWREAAAIGAQVAAALAAAHDRGVVHRDITPGNIMLTPTGAKVLDFGISTIAGETVLTVAGRALGTPAYLAPERLTAGTHGRGGGVNEPPGPAVDVYSLAAVLVHAVTGRTPYEGSWSEQAQAHVHAPPPALIGVPDEFAQLLAACLAKDPTARPRSADMARALRHIGGDGQQPTPARPAGAAVAPPGGAAARTIVVGAQGRPPDATRVLTTYAEPGDSRPARRRDLNRVAAWIALATAILVAVLVAANLLTRPSPAPSDTAGTDTTQPSEPSPEPTAAQPDELTVEEALREIDETARAAITTGDMTLRAALELGGSLARASEQMVNGNYRAAQRTLDNAVERLERRADDGEVSDAVRAEINDLIAVVNDRVAAAMRANG